MPMVTVKVIEGVFTPQQKQEMIRKITDTMVEIEGENLRPVTWVLVEEVHSGDWGIAGNGLTTGDVHALQGQPTAAARPSAHRGCGRAAAPATARPEILGAASPGCAGRSSAEPERTGCGAVL
jgi:4-oxalocrotonate tautomerase